MYPTTDLARWRLALELATMQMRCDCLLEEKGTERERLLEQVKAGRPRLWERCLLRTSDVLISTGLWLKSRRQATSALSVLEVGDAEWREPARSECAG